MKIDAIVNFRERVANLPLSIILALEAQNEIYRVIEGTRVSILGD